MWPWPAPGGPTPSPRRRWPADWPRRNFRPPPKRVPVADRTRRPGVPGRPGSKQVVPLFEQSLEAEGQVGPCGAQLAMAGPVQFSDSGKAEQARCWLEKAQAWLDNYRDRMPAGAEEELAVALPQLAGSSRPAP